ncbi:PaaI family thioesterase [Dietzia sp.]|uniref:PaaI family thioesterase n=1 Tax=Dietzia sp. TaxID=1871616 RepID=UPI002FD90AA8
MSESTTGDPEATKSGAGKGLGSGSGQGSGDDSGQAEGHGSGQAPRRPHAVAGAGDPQLADAKSRLGESFEPFEISVTQGTDTALDDAGEQMRRLRDALTGIGESGAELGEIAELLRRAADLAEAQAPSDPEKLATQWRKGGPGARRTNPVGGPENVIAPPLTVVGHDDGRVTSRVALGIPYQGPPGCVHGGISALLLDHLFGHANFWAGYSGMTAHYELDYRKPTPLLKPLDLTAWVESSEGRKIWVRASIECEGELCVEARALFIKAHVPLPGRDETALGEER